MTVTLPDADALRVSRLLGLLIREAAQRGRPVPRDGLEAWRRLLLAIDTASPEMSAAGQGFDGGEAMLVSTAEAAKVLGWSERHVRRRAADLDGRQVAGVWMYPQAVVMDYAKAIERQGESS